MDDVSGFEDMGQLDRYNAVIRKIAQTAPIRICPGEKSQRGRDAGHGDPPSCSGDL